eukprot:IDg20075t1
MLTCSPTSKRTRQLQRNPRCGRFCCTGKINKLFRNTTSKKYFGWFDLIINGLLTFSVCESNVFRSHVKHDSIALSTFMTYLPRLTSNIESRISALLPEKFSIVFDGWTTGSTHYLAVFESFASPSPDGFSLRLLAFSPMIDESRLDAEEHVQFMQFTLELFKKSWSNVVCLIGDNCKPT